MTRLSQLMAEIIMQSRVFWRVPIAAFFTFVFPLMFLLLFNALNRGAVLETMGGLTFAQFFTPGIAVFGLVTASYTNLAIATSMARDQGVFKRVKGTPCPMWVHLAGRVGASLWVGVLSVVVMVTVGALLFGVVIPWERMPQAALVMVMGYACFAALGLAVAGISPSGRASPAIANATILPLTFVSGIFFPLQGAPGWLETAAGWFPLRPMAAAVGEAFNPLVPAPFPGEELLVMGAWLVLGAVVAIRTFSWEPKEAGRQIHQEPGR